MVASKKKIRADIALFERGLVESRSKASALIMAGKVYAYEKRIEKAGELILQTQSLTVRSPKHKWVGRGGLKLDHGLKHFELTPKSRICLDIGSSTGGFTDVLLHYGASKVYAIDVGYGQLDSKLRNDDRVIVKERTNARYMSSEVVPESVDAIVCDASFIGLRTILPMPMKLASDGCWLVALIKPQFEVGPKKVGKGGIVRDDSERINIYQEIYQWLSNIQGWTVIGSTESPIKGANGNIEFLIAATYSDRISNPS